MLESSMRNIVVSALKSLDAMSVENTVRPGTPDINYIDGWIELKILPKWPNRDIPVRVPCFTPQQRVWLRRRWLLGGECYFLLRVADDWVLLDGITAAEGVGKLDKNEMTKRSILFMPGKFYPEELKATLRHGRSKSI